MKTALKTPPVKKSASTARAELARALAEAVQKEARYGNRQDVRAELDARWLAVAEMILG